MALTYKLLACDVDGTLMDSRNCLPDAHRLALHRAHSAGLTVCLCTGRCLTETRAVIDQLGLDSDIGVFAFGALINELPSGRTIQRTPIPEPLASRLVGHFQARGYPVLLLHDASEAGFDYLYLAGERNVAAYERWLSVATARCEQGDCRRPGALRIGIIVQPDDIAEAIQAMADEFSAGELKVNPIYAPNYGLHVVECFAPMVNKWYAIQEVARRLGVAPGEIVAVGDDVNDVEMIAHAGLGVAMGNAVSQVKAVARCQAPSNDHAGLAAVVDAILKNDGRIDGTSSGLIIPARTCSCPAAPR